MKSFKTILPLAMLFSIVFADVSHANDLSNTLRLRQKEAAHLLQQIFPFKANHKVFTKQVIATTDGTIPVTLTEPYGEDEGYLITLTGANGESYSFNTWDRNYSFDGSTYTFYPHIVPDVYTVDITATYTYHYDVGFSYEDSNGDTQNPWEGEYELSYDNGDDFVSNNIDIGNVAGNSLDFQVGIDSY
jgi:hypothetical protein